MLRNWNLSEFPLKIAKIIPVHKAKQKDIASNYRPVSLLSPISKVFEKLLYIRLERFFSKNNVITKQQFGFRCGYITEMAITDLYNRVVKIEMRVIILAVYFWICQKLLAP